MSFKVSTEALRAFADQLEGCALDIELIEMFIRDNGQMGLTEQGLLHYVAGSHDNMYFRVQDRVQLMRGFTGESSLAVNDAAFYYESTDEDKAAEMDALYPAMSHEELQPGGPEESYSFTDVVDPTTGLDLDLACSDLAPTMSDLEKTVRDITAYVSPAAWIGAFCKDLFGFDPIQETAQFFVGDWEQFARCAGVWKACEIAVGHVATNLEYCDEALAAVWEGNAADAAIDYFQRHHQAVQGEAEFFGVLYEAYVALTEMTWHAAQIIVDELSYLIDTFASAAAVAMTSASTGGVPGAITGGVLWAVYEIVNSIITLIGLVMQAYHLFEAVLAANDAARKLPGSGFLDMKQNKETGYQYPPVAKD